MSRYIQTYEDFQKKEPRAYVKKVHTKQWGIFIQGESLPIGADDSKGEAVRIASNYNEEIDKEERIDQHEHLFPSQSKY